MKAAKKIGIVRKRGDALTRWYKYWCILSGGYLYFYETNMQPQPSFYYYIHDALILEGYAQIGVRNSLIVNNIYI